jgi:hypothetical protein
MLHVIGFSRKRVANPQLGYSASKVGKHLWICSAACSNAWKGAARLAKAYITWHTARTCHARHAFSRAETLLFPRCNFFLALQRSVPANILMLSDSSAALHLSHWKKLRSGDDTSSRYAFGFCFAVFNMFIISNRTAFCPSL